MKCMSCQVEINPQWKHAIDINVCPFCGKEIMETVLKDLFSSLRATMESLSAYPDQLNDWMLSNHGYIKTDSKQLSKFLPKQKQAENKEDESIGEEYIVNVQTENGEEPVVAKKIQSEERTNSFFKRAEAVKPGIDGFRTTEAKTKHLKEMVQQIKGSGSASIDSSGGASFLPSEMMDNADPEAVAELQALIDGGDPIASSLPDMGNANNGEEEIPMAVMAMAGKAKSGADKDARDLLRLQQMVNKSQRSGGGSFSRSGS